MIVCEIPGELLQFHIAFTAAGMCGIQSMAQFYFAGVCLILRKQGFKRLNCSIIRENVYKG